MIETLVDEEGAPVPSVRSADIPITQKLASAKATKWAKLEQSACRQVERAALPRPSLLPVSVPDCINQDQSPSNQEILQQSSVMQTPFNINYGRQSLPRITQETSNLPSSVSDVLSQSSPKCKCDQRRGKREHYFYPGSIHGRRK